MIFIDWKISLMPWDHSVQLGNEGARHDVKNAVFFFKCTKLPERKDSSLKIEF